MNLSCWQILGIEPTDDQEIIRNAYRKKLPEHHPENDPQGFQNLRQAYEQAKKGIQSDFRPISALDNEPIEPIVETETEPEPEIKELHPEQQVIDQLTEDLETLLNDANQRYQPDAWHQYIQKIDSHSIEVTNQLRWSLLMMLYNTSYVSRDCVQILAERMRWKQRITELRGESVEHLDDYLDYIAKGDIFDMTLLAGLPLAAQNASVDHINSINFLFWERPAWMLREYLLQSMVVYWPDSPEVMELRCRWYTLAGIGSEHLSDYCLQQLTKDPENSDWLYLYASQCSMSGHDDRALPFWIRLYQAERHATAEAWLLTWCVNHSPERTPLLIQALDNAQYLPADGVAIDAPEQRYITPTQTTKTLLRWGEVLQSPMPLIAEDFAKWRLHKETPITMIRHLILDDGSDPVVHLYRHASMLRLGNETLLQQIIDEPESGDPLDDLILSRFKLQAQQRLDWLKTSMVIQAFTHWLYAPQPEALPAELAQRDSEAHLQCLHWLLQRRWLANEQLERLANSETFGSNLETITDWISFIALNNSASLPEPANNQDYWQWCRQCYALVLLLERPAESLPMLIQAKNITPEEQHPLYEFCQLINQLDAQQDNIVEQYRDKLTLSYILQHHSWTRLPITPEDYLENQQTTRSYSIDHFYISSLEWRGLIEKSSNINQMVFYAACAWFGLNGREKRFTTLIEEMQLSNEAEQALREALLNAKPYAQINEVRNPRLKELISETLDMRRNPHRVLSENSQKSLWDCQQNPNEDITLRLVAKLLLQESRYRGKNPVQTNQQPSKFWEFWRFKSRLNRTGFAAQLLLGTLLSFIIGVIMIKMSDSAIGPLVLVALFLTSSLGAMIRRANDLNLSNTAIIIMAVVSTIFPVTMTLSIIYLLLAPGVPFANKAGPPANGWFNQP
ncbi:DUF805 domain-containing protein [Budviciaceae bacterium CWB-B4]|uniref:DUF805 domain-containing protein n=1 Tax=Limnobaculum xujianqingii TaxID=2738837 RepID=A0A9D7ALC7_9GAMM|nr:DUF805 domain-containing protein [Limnobaculum xujianqingii]MBK5074753.1 DUF805 domain-containing protein [Limnobaculum xujianqingii]MBK5178063.1 DUF805 domain-containing protein [Limnobaculum xujianqingii]